MIPARSPEYLAGMVRELLLLPSETEWVEFKGNNNNPETIGKNISALANGAAVNGKTSASAIWGIDDETHAIVGTNFSPSTARKGNEPLETWLYSKINPNIEFRFNELNVDGQRVVLLEIEPASRQPVSFGGEDFIRVGGSTRSLKDYPEKQRTLWHVFDQITFENRVAVEQVSDEDTLQNLYYPAYFDLLDRSIPDGRAAILNALKDDKLIARCDAGGWNISNLGAVLFARNLNDFPQIRRKAMRVIQYSGAGRTETLREQEVVNGYAVGFQGIIEYIMALVPTNEVFEHSLRRSVPMFPEIAVRELVANALIHQDFRITGAGPMVEIFDSRIEITNPGRPLVETDRFVDSPPRSLNETLASMMRRFNFCEERGSGIDRVVQQAEFYQLPAPLFEAPNGFTRTTLFAQKPLAEMDKTDRVRACYLHACLRYVMRLPMNNASIRERFGIAEKNSSQASRLLNESVDSGLVIIRDPEVGTKIRTYLPYWAGELLY
ncbi:MAG: putative DNA binding domain-containing protein [Caldilineaceae bacterium]|nr:putative DNA binding domain-containing protein [Caldilineaceae bacterium]